MKQQQSHLLQNLLQSRQLRNHRPQRRRSLKGLPLKSSLWRKPQHLKSPPKNLLWKRKVPSLSLNHHHQNQMRIHQRKILIPNSLLLMKLPKAQRLLKNLQSNRRLPSLRPSQQQILQRMDPLKTPSLNLKLNLLKRRLLFSALPRPRNQQPKQEPTPLENPSLKVNLTLSVFS